MKSQNEISTSIAPSRRRSYLASDGNNLPPISSKRNSGSQDSGNLNTPKGAKDETAILINKKNDSDPEKQNNHKPGAASVYPLSSKSTQNSDRGFKQELTKFLVSKNMDYFMICLIVVYTILVMVDIVIDDLSCDDKSLLVISTDLEYLELAIVIIFMLEIVLKVYGLGFKGYFKDYLYYVDAFIIGATFALVLIDLSNDSLNLSGISKIRGVFRLFRIFLLMRKANEFAKRTKRRLTGIDVRSPVEKILDLLNVLQQEISDKSVKEEIIWAIDMISSNKLYEPLIEEGTDINAEKTNEVRDWVKSFAAVKSESKNEPRGSRRKSLNLVDSNAKNSGNSVSFSHIPSETMAKIENEINELHFNTLEMKIKTNGDDLSIILYILFRKNDLFSRLNIPIPTFNSFAKKIQSGYVSTIPYHNASHGCDVTQTINYFLTTGDFIEIGELKDHEIAAMYIAAAIHDYEHPGFNNAFQINTRSEFAIRYNDKAVLENHHVSASFKLMADDNFNIFKNFTREDYIKIRERIVSMVLATDMAQHFADIGKFKGRLAADFNPKEKDKNLCMELILHCCDISNPVKPWEISRDWAFRVLEEFWIQGDKERELGLPITHLCDRYTTNTAKSQIGFINFIVAPTFEILQQALPKIDISNLAINKSKWEELIEQYDKELAKLNEDAKKKLDETKKDADLKGEKTKENSDNKAA